jgi:hypothetical protein
MGNVWLVWDDHRLTVTDELSAASDFEVPAGEVYAPAAGEGGLEHVSIPETWTPYNPPPTPPPAPGPRREPKD